MAEEITLAAPVQADQGAVRFRIAALLFEWEQALITVRLREWNGGAFIGARHVDVRYEGAEATLLMTQLNKANLTTKSLHTRVMEKLQTDGKLPAGTISGAPE